MKVNFMKLISILALLGSMLCGCQSAPTGNAIEIEGGAQVTEPTISFRASDNTISEGSAESAPALLYMGQASIRIITPENKVIYIDPYAGNEADYEPSADLILVTHSHYDHSDVEKVENRSENCRVITYREAIDGSEHITFELDYVTVQPVEAGYNSLHKTSNCVGYVLTFTNGKSVYVTGDTSKTNQMSEMAAMNIDYAFYCSDGVYNMGLEEAAECAELVGAKHNIPYHNSTSNTGAMFDEALAEQFDAPNLFIVVPGEEIAVE